MAGLLSRLFGGAEETRISTSAGSLGYPGRQNVYVPDWELNQAKWPENTFAAYNAQGYLASSLIFRCVQFTANAMGTAPLRVYQSAEDIDRSTAVDDHPLRKLMRQPNLGQSEQTFLTFVGTLLCVTGFAVIEKERNLLGEIIGLWPLRSDWLKPIPRANALPDWEYSIPGKRPKVLKADDVIPLTYADTIDNSPTGMGPLEAALRNIGIADSLTTFIKSFMDRGALPPYVGIASDDPYTAALWSDPAKVKTWRESFRDTFGGTDKSSSGIIIAAGLKEVRPLGYNMDEMAYPDLFALNDNAICQAFGISPIVLNTTSGLEQSSYNNYSSARRSFYEDTMFPLWGRIDDAFTRHLLSEMADMDKFSLAFDVRRVPALKDDVTEAWTRATDAFSAGRISMNTALRHSDLDVIPNGDVYFVPDGVSVIEEGDLKTGAIQQAEAQGDIVSATGIAKVTGKPPHGEKINRGVDSRSASRNVFIDEDGKEWRWVETTDTEGYWIEWKSDDNEACEDED